MRKLVTVQIINNITEIPGKDNIVLATVLGWHVIVKKSEFKIGDPCVFFEIDSFLPIEDRYEFLAKSKKNYLGKDGYRIKTMKMAGVISQGLALPLPMFPEFDEYTPTDFDLSDKLNVVKYDRAEIEARTGKVHTGKTAGNFPAFIPKTDQTRIQSLPLYFSMYKHDFWEESLKLDGSSMTVYKIPAKLKWYHKLVNKILPMFHEYHFGVCSRNLELKRPERYSESAFWQTAVKQKLESHLPVGYALQGELIGPNIQSNHEKVHDFEYHIFDVYNIDQQRYLSPYERLDFLTKNNLVQYSIKVTEPLCQIFDICPTIEDLVARVDSESINPGTISEGRVYKLYNNPSISFKCINNQYLLKEK